MDINVSLYPKGREGLKGKVMERLERRKRFHMTDADLKVNSWIRFYCGFCLFSFYYAEVSELLIKKTLQLYLPNNWQVGLSKLKWFCTAAKTVGSKQEVHRMRESLPAIQLTEK